MSDDKMYEVVEMLARIIVLSIEGADYWELYNEAADLIKDMDGGPYLEDLLIVLDLE